MTSDKPNSSNEQPRDVVDCAPTPKKKKSVAGYSHQVVKRVQRMTETRLDLRMQEALKVIDDSKAGEGIGSLLFASEEAPLVKWRLWVYPRGLNEKNEGQFCVVVQLQSQVEGGVHARAIDIHLVKEDRRTVPVDHVNSHHFVSSSKGMASTPIDEKIVQEAVCSDGSLTVACVIEYPSADGMQLLVEEVASSGQAYRHRKTEELRHSKKTASDPTENAKEEEDGKSGSREKAKKSKETRSATGGRKTEEKDDGEKGGVSADSATVDATEDVKEKGGGKSGSEEKKANDSREERSGSAVEESKSQEKKEVKKDADDKVSQGASVSSIPTIKKESTHGEVLGRASPIHIGIKRDSSKNARGSLPTNPASKEKFGKAIEEQRLRPTRSAAYQKDKDPLNKVWNEINNK